MAARKPARYLAPLALLAIAAAIALVVRDQLATHSHVPTTTVLSPTLVQHSRIKSSRHRRTFYVVKPGDTLSGISVKTGVAVAILEQLNPGLDPNALQTGQRLRLRR